MGEFIFHHMISQSAAHVYLLHPVGVGEGKGGRGSKD